MSAGFALQASQTLSGSERQKAEPVGLWAAALLAAPMRTRALLLAALLSILPLAGPAAACAPADCVIAAMDASVAYGILAKDRTVENATIAKDTAAAGAICAKDAAVAGSIGGVGGCSLDAGGRAESAALRYAGEMERMTLEFLGALQRIVFDAL